MKMFCITSKNFLLPSHTVVQSISP